MILPQISKRRNFCLLFIFIIFHKSLMIYQIGFYYLVYGRAISSKRAGFCSAQVSNVMPDSSMV